LAAVPLVSAGCAPTQSHNNEARAIQSRIVDVANTTAFSEEMISYAVEFVGHVVPVWNKGVPLEIAELRLLQDKPMQISRRVQEEQHLAGGSTNLTTKSFQKKEVYAKPGDPRLINQVPTDHTTRLGCFSAAIKSHFRKTAGRWFYVGKTPLQIANGLRGLQSSVGKQLVGGDYSRMDGRTSVDYRRYVLEPIYMSYFDCKYHQELKKLLESERAAFTRTSKFGVRASTSGANLSGSGVTTDLNTLDAAFNEYAAWRIYGLGPGAAYSKLGAYFGDDSVVDPEIFDDVVKVAAQNGMKMERAPTSGSWPGVHRVSRTCLPRYPDVPSVPPSSGEKLEQALRRHCRARSQPEGPDDQAALKGERGINY